jgi:hypothetical protein
MARDITPAFLLGALYKRRQVQLCLVLGGEPSCLGVFFAFYPVVGGGKY